MRSNKHKKVSRKREEEEEEEEMEDEDEERGRIDRKIMYFSCFSDSTQGCFYVKLR